MLFSPAQAAANIPRIRESQPGPHDASLPQPVGKSKNKPKPRARTRRRRAQARKCSKMSTIRTKKRTTSFQPNGRTRRTRRKSQNHGAISASFSDRRQLSRSRGRLCSSNKNCPLKIPRRARVPARRGLGKEFLWRISGTTRLFP